MGMPVCPNCKIELKEIKSVRAGLSYTTFKLQEDGTKLYYDETDPKEEFDYEELIFCPECGSEIDKQVIESMLP